MCATRLLLLLLFVSIQKLTFVHSLKPRVYAVEPNVLLNEMFTLFCDQSSNSASRQTLSLSLILSGCLFHSPSLPIHSTCLQNANTPRWNNNKAQPYASCISMCLFVIFFDYTNEKVSGMCTVDREVSALERQRESSRERNKWRRTCLNLPSQQHDLDIEHTNIQTIYGNTSSFVRSFARVSVNCYGCYATGEPLHFTNC